LPSKSDGRSSRRSAPGHDPGRPSRNLFTDVEGRLAAERIDVLVEVGAVRLERIVSTGHATPPGEWYDQDRDEWVVVLRGSAGLRFEGEPGERVMHAGDHLVIPAHRRHRVEWTDSREPTVWLAVRYPGAGSPTTPM
jgi:cupin 2 domain-containing protein